jgi:hypothetical protein
VHVALAYRHGYSNDGIFVDAAACCVRVQRSPAPVGVAESKSGVCVCGGGGGGYRQRKSVGVRQGKMSPCTRTTLSILAVLEKDAERGDSLWSSAKEKLAWAVQSVATANKGGVTHGIVT